MAAMSWALIVAFLICMRPLGIPGGVHLMNLSYWTFKVCLCLYLSISLSISLNGPLKALKGLNFAITGLNKAFRALVRPLRSSAHQRVGRLFAHEPRKVGLRSLEST